MASNILLILLSLLFIAAVVKFFLPNLKFTTIFKNVWSNNDKYEDEKVEDKENISDKVNDKIILIVDQNEVNNINKYEWHNEIFKNGGIREQQKFVSEKTIFFRSFDENGKIRSLYRHTNTIKVGRLINFYETGNICAILNFVDGKLNGELTEYYNNGTIKLIANYEDGRREGKITEFFNINSIFYSKTKLVSAFHRDELNGELNEYYENGELKRKSRYLSGKLDGEQVYFYENGQVREKKFLVNDSTHGENTIYTEFGMIAKKKFYNSGELLEEIDNISKLKARILMYSQLLNDESIKTPVFENFMNCFYFVFGDIHRFTNKDNTKDSKKGNSEYDKFCKEIQESLFNEIKSFDKNNYKTKYRIEEERDIEYLFTIILGRAWNNIVELDIDPKNKYEWQKYHFDTYLETYIEDKGLGEEHYIKTLEAPLVCFIHIYNKLNNALNKIKALDSELNITKNIHFKIYELLIAHTHATIYAYIALVKEQIQFKDRIEESKYLKAILLADYRFEDLHHARKIIDEFIEEQVINIKKNQISDGVKNIIGLKNKKEQNKAIEDFILKNNELIAINHLAMNLIEIKDYNKAIEILERKMDNTKIIHDLNAALPTHANFYDTLSQAYYHTKSFKKALYFSNISIELDSNSKNISGHYYNRSRIRLKIGELEKAKIDLKKAIEVDSNKEAEKLLKEVSDPNDNAANNLLNILQQNSNT